MEQLLGNEMGQLLLGSSRTEIDASQHKGNHLVARQQLTNLQSKSSGILSRVRFCTTLYALVNLYMHAAALASHGQLNRLRAEQSHLKSCTLCTATV